MCTRCWSRILQAMGRTYPEPIDLDAVCQHSGLSNGKVRCELWGLVDYGYVEVRGSPSWAGLPWSLPRLTEAGLAVAFGLASVEDDPLGVIGLLEAATLRELERLKKRRSNRSAAACRAPTPQVDVYPPHCTALRAEMHVSNDATVSGSMPFAQRFAGGVAAATPAAPAGAAAATTPPVNEVVGYTSMSAAEAAFAETMVNVMCPADAHTPNGVDCGLRSAHRGASR